MLSEGGTAVDAAIAAGICQGVMNPMASGLGGGHFMLVRWALGGRFWCRAVQVGISAAGHAPTGKSFGQAPLRRNSTARLRRSEPAAAVCRLPNGTAEVIDAREVAPAAANETMFKGGWAGGRPARPSCCWALLARVTRFGLADNG